MTRESIVRWIFDRERITFLIVGVSTVLVDLFAYSLLYVVLAQPLSAAKSIGFIVGAAFSYWANGRFTFPHNVTHQTAVWRFALLYSITLGVNVIMNKAVVGALAPLSTAFAIAFFFATAASTIANYLGMKFLVFRQS